MKRKVAHVILASGGGEGFWPLSTADHPKQFLDLDGSGRTFLQEAYDRVRAAGGGVGTLYVQTPARYEELVRQQLPDLPVDQILIEPVARGTAASVGLAALEVRERLGDVVMAVVPSHHRVRGIHAFTRSLRTAVKLAASTKGVVVLAVAVDDSVAGRGYVECGAEVGSGYRATRFIDQPHAPPAIPRGRGARVACNAGIFVSHVGVMCEELATHAPEVFQPLELAHTTHSLHHGYARLPERSFERAILQATERAYVVHATFEWDDVADWGALGRVSVGVDAFDNSVVGRHVGIETEGLIAYDREVDGVIATLGVRDVVIVRRAGVVLLVAKERLPDLHKLSGHPELNDVDPAGPSAAVAVEA